MVFESGRQSAGPLILAVRAKWMIAVETRSNAQSKRLRRRTARWPGRWAFLVACVGGIVLVGSAYAPVVRWWTRSGGEHMTLVEARARVRLDLPDDASDIRFYQHLRPDEVVLVDFAITESAFLAWAKGQGWKPKPIVGSVTIWPRSAIGDWDTVVTVTDGYEINTLRRGEPNTFAVAYDRPTRRAFYRFSSTAVAGDD
jgi:hypothetical protein